MNKSRIIWTSVGAVVVVAGGFLWLKHGAGIGNRSTLGGVADIEAQGGKVEIESMSTSTSPVAMPNLHHVVVFSAQMVPEAKTIVLKNIATLQAKLASKTAQENFAVWNSLAQNYQVAGDYAAAANVWEYLLKAFPTNHVAYGNLGYLYGYYLKDPARAEQDYLKAIQNAPDQTFLYFQTAEFYRDVMKNTAKAVAVVQAGLAKNPQNTELKQLLGTLK